MGPHAAETWLDACASADYAIAPARWRLGSRYRSDELERICAEHPFIGQAEARVWLHLHRDELRRAVEHAAGDGLDRTAWELCEALWTLWSRFRHFAAWEATHRLGLAAAMREGNRRAEARMRVQWGFALAEQQHHDAAAEQFAKALTAEQATGHHRGEATALEALALVAVAEWRTDEALDLLGQAQAALYRAGDPVDARAAALLMFHRGRVLFRDGDIHGAHLHLQQAEGRLRGLDPPDVYNAALAHTELARVHIEAQEYVLALDLLDTADELRALGAYHREAEALQELSWAAGHFGNHPVGTEAAGRILDLRTVLGRG
ncbi:hypothetical protein [Yinghuangia soli]|uniref:MalT-like TPR region domain-containing protein n=1 Tax=Yinghuangia soli TaxID=2908204 RepID=A0AA41U5G0_9ACTN|nr:hypothetical protein [Yinghuangia soli]MCF2531887.1 hypothetical protein [Yinghuangia soli]